VDDLARELRADAPDDEVRRRRGVCRAEGQDPVA
jgi:hypothetical protein